MKKNLKLIIASVFICSAIQVVHGMDMDKEQSNASKVIYLKAAYDWESTKLKNSLQHSKQVALTTENSHNYWLANINFILEQAQFHYDNKNINFTQQPSVFLDKINTLKIEGNKSYNHLCLTLYAIYQEGDNTSELKVVESPLFARAVRPLDNGEGNLQESVEYYTTTAPTANDRWAYFTTYHADTNDVKADGDIFSISSESYHGAGCDNAVCGEFYNSHEQKNACRHTEPHALFHVKKNSSRLFNNLLPQDQKIIIKKAGIRFFSYYQSCYECASMLCRNRSLYIRGNNFNLDFIFYFNRTLCDPVIKIDNNAIKLATDYHNNYFFSGFLKDNLIYIRNSYGADIEAGQVLACLPLEENINLNQARPHFFLIKHFDNYEYLMKDVSTENRFRIYFLDKS